MLGLSLFIGQAFLYNSVFFTYALVLDKFYGVGANAVGFYIFAFAIGNFLGPLLLGRFFDSVGRKPMIAGTYILSGVLLTITAILFQSGTLTATSQTAAWCVIFFFASAGASAAYLTVSEIFPMETRAMAISFFYAVGTAIGGITGPLLFGRLIEAGGETNVMYGYLLGAALMIAAGIVEIVLGVEAAQKQLEDIAKPLTAEDAEAGGAGDIDLDKIKGEDARRTRSRDELAAGHPSSPAARRDAARTTTTSSASWRCSSARVAEQGELPRRELGRLVGCRYWGPGRFGRALRAGVQQGRLSRPRRGVYGPGGLDRGARKARDRRPWWIDLGAL